MDHLSSMDAAFLHLETPETPMHVGSLMLFELPKGYKGDYYDDVKAVIASRIHLIRLFRRKLAQMPFELADPVWIDDDDIDLDYHIRHLTLRKPGTMAQLEDVVARLHSTMLDRSRPLWEVTVIDGLENGQIGYYTKAHHSGIDGKAGIELAKVIYDPTPEIRKVPAPSQRRARSGYQLGMAELLEASLSNTAAQYSKLAKLLPTAASAVAAASQAFMEQLMPREGRGVNLGLSAKTRFNVAVTNQRSYTTMVLPLPEIKELGRRVGGTVNTIVMAMAGTALRRFFSERGETPEGSIMAAVPVSLRSPGDDQMNNQVSVVRVDLSTDIRDAQQRFRAVHQSSEAAKAVVTKLKPALGVDLPMVGSPWLMTGMATLVARSGLPGRLPPLASVLISNIPGLPTPMYLAGARMKHFYPLSIPYHGNAVNITVQSYTDQLEFGITACRMALSQEEARELMSYMRDALDEIRGFETVTDSARALAGASASAARDQAPARMPANSAAGAAEAHAASIAAAATAAATDADVVVRKTTGRKLAGKAAGSRAGKAPARKRAANGGRKPPLH